MIVPGRDGPDADEPSPEAFARRTRELGLDLAPDDVAELRRGWIGLQPFLVRIRTGLAPLQRLEERPPGVAGTSRGLKPIAGAADELPS